MTFFTDKETAVECALRKMPKEVWNWRETARLLPRARRFIFTEDASRRLGEIIEACGAPMMNSTQFAIPPYPVTYVDVSIKDVNEGIGRRVSTDEFDGIPEDNRVGFLITEDAIRVYARGEDSSFGVASVFRYERHGEDELAYRLNPREVHPDMVDHVRAAQRHGTTFHEMEDPYAILDEWKVKIAYSKHKRYVPLATVRGTYGELRVILCALLVLNQPHAVNLASVPAKRGNAASRNRPYAAHNIVELKLGEKKKFTKYFGPRAMRAPARRHEVTGHFVHNHCRKGCIHEWPLEPTAAIRSGAPSWTCARCGGVRTWRKAFERGDSTVGFVTKTYEVDY